MDVKTLLSKTSTTYLAAIVAGVVSLGKMLGYELVTEDVTNVVIMLALLFVFIGRAKASGPMTWWARLFGGKSGKSSQSGFAARTIPHALLMGGLGASLLLLFMGAHGCAALQDRTNFTLYEMADTYMDLHEDYVTAFNASDQSGRAWMRSEIAPAMDKAKHVLDTALTTAIAGQEVREQDLSEAKAALTEAALAISDLIAGREE